MPLCTILTKWPAPSGPTYVTHGPESVLAAMASRIGATCWYAWRSPAGMSDGPRRAPSSPPETPMPKKWTMRSRQMSSRRMVSLKWELPPSMTMSPGARYGMIFCSVWSTGSPALIIIRMRRGRSSERHSSCKDLVPISCRPAFWRTNWSTQSVSRFHTATECPWSSTFRARFSPMTPRPMTPNCAVFKAVPTGIGAPVGNCPG